MVGDVSQGVLSELPNAMGYEVIEADGSSVRFHPPDEPDMAYLLRFGQGTAVLTNNGSLPGAAVKATLLRMLYPPRKGRDNNLRTFGETRDSLFFHDVDVGHLERTVCDGMQLDLFREGVVPMPPTPGTVSERSPRYADPEQLSLRIGYF